MMMLPEPAEPFVVQTWTENAGGFELCETISFETADQATRLAAFAAKRRAGVLVYRSESHLGRGATLIARFGRTPPLAVIPTPSDGLH